MNHNDAIVGASILVALLVTGLWVGFGVGVALIIKRLRHWTRVEVLRFIAIWTLSLIVAVLLLLLTAQWVVAA